MRHLAYPILSLSLTLAFAAGLAAARAQTVAEAQVAAAAPPIDVPASQPAVAVRAAQAAQAAQGTPTGANPPPNPVESSTAQPDPDPKPRVIASTDAASLSHPNFKPSEAADAPPLTVGIGDNTVAGKVSVDNSPPPTGLLKSNPGLMGGAKRSDVGLSAKF